jgi:5'-nucleotidase
MIIIGIDVDDTVANLMDSWLYIYNQEYNDGVSQRDIKSWDISKYVKCGHSIYKYLRNPDLYNIVEPVENAKWGVDRLRSMGFRLVFITASTQEQSTRKYRWLSEYGMIDERKNYIECLDKSLVMVDYLIDDNPENVINAHGQGVVFTKEWNKTLVGYPRVDSWQDIVEYFVRVENQIEMTGV